jgi:hypothetical protein
MNSQSVASIVELALQSYRYDPPAGTIGVPWSRERVRRQIEQLREALIQPELRPIRRVAPEVSAGAVQDLWVVAVADNFVVFYDPVPAEFGLALQSPAGDTAQSIAVNGDLVGTFCAR